MEQEELMELLKSIDSLREQSEKKLKQQIQILEEKINVEVKSRLRSADHVDTYKNSLRV